MPKRIAALAVVLVLALAGCAESTDAAPEERSAPAGSESTEQESAPATVEPTDEAETTVTDDEQWFLDHSFIGTLDLDDETKLAAGWYACEQIEAGNLDVVAVEGVDADTNEAIVADATVVLCPAQADTYAAHRQS